MTPREWLASRPRWVYYYWLVAALLGAICGVRFVRWHWGLP